jgi:hypothetical protein
MRIHKQIGKHMFMRNARRNALLACATAGCAAAIALFGTSQAQSPSEFSNWSFEAIGTGIKPAIAVDPDGTPHIAYLREANPGAAYYATIVDGAWAAREAEKGYFYGPIDIDVGPDGIPFITYHDHERFPPDLAHGSGIVLAVGANKFDRTKIDDPGHDQWDADIAATENGVWHMAGIDPSQFASSDGLEYATNLFGDIRVENVGSGSLAYEFGVSIEVAPDGTVGISYYKDGADDLVFAERPPGDPSQWTLTVVDTQGRVGRYSDLAFDDAGNPHISYWVFDDAISGRVRYATRNADGDWSTEDAGTLSDLAGGQLGARKITAIELGSDNVPQIMYGDRSEIVHGQRQTDGTWSAAQIVSAGDRPLGQLVEFDLGPDGRPHLTYYEVTGTEPGLPALTGEIFYGTAN